MQGERSQCQPSGLGDDQWVGPSTGPDESLDDSHLQDPRGAVAAAAAAASRLLSVSVRVRSVDMEETSLAGEDVDARCCGCGPPLTVAPVL